MAFSVPLRLGPFVGGLNTEADPASISPTELVDGVNWDLDLDSSLKTRPPIQNTTDLAGSWSERILMLGYGVFSGSTYLIGANTNGTYYYNAGAWTLINAFRAVACVQYFNKLYLLSKVGEAVTLATWSPGGGYAAVVSANLDIMNPSKGGGNLVIFKERLYICPGPSGATNESRLIFSDAGNAGVFSTTTQFIDVHPGDGEKLNDFHIYADNLILFKDNQTFHLSYTGSPTNADLIEINHTIGVQGKHCVVSYENSVFVFHHNKLYEMGGSYDFQKVNVKVPFVFDGNTPSARSENFSLSLMGDRIIVRYFNRIYTYGLKTKAFLRWSSADPVLHNFGRLVMIPNLSTTGVPDQYYAGSCVTSSKRVFLIQDGLTGTDQEQLDSVPVSITSSLVTKSTDAFMYRKMIIDNVHQYKKLKWWGIDCVTPNAVTGSANPIVYGFKVTWGSLFSSGTLWSSLGTWANPATSNMVTSTSPAPGTSVDRVFIKMPHALRYRQLNFSVSLTSSGKSSDSGALFSVTVIMSLRQTVSARIS